MNWSRRALYNELCDEVRRQIKFLEELRTEEQNGKPDYRWLSKKHYLPVITERQQQIMENLANKLSAEQLRKSIKLLQTLIVPGCNISPADVADLMIKILKQIAEEYKMATLFRECPKKVKKILRSPSLSKHLNQEHPVDTIETITAEIESRESH